MPRVLLRPGWVISHLVVIAIAVAFVNLGLWQLRRLDERRALNQTLETRLAQEPQPLSDVLERFGNDPAALPYRRVAVTGTYRPDLEVLLTPRNSQGEPGHHVLTPLVLDDGTAVLVERGWVPFVLDDPPIEQAAPPRGEVIVEGLLHPTQTATRAGAFNGGEGLEFLSVPDADRLQGQVDVTLLPFWVTLRQQSPPAETFPRTPALPDQTEGPHLSYALQWFGFTLVGVIGYPLLLRRRLRQERLPADGRDAAVSSERNTRKTKTTSSTTTP